MQNHPHNRKYLRVVMVIVVVCLVGMLFAFTHYRITIQYNYFINVDNPEEVHSIIASEFSVGETSKSEVENALYNGVFGNLDCRGFQYGGGSDISDSLIVCDALGSYNILFPRTYKITMGFWGDVLSEFEVQSFTNVP